MFKVNNKNTRTTSVTMSLESFNTFFPDFRFPDVFRGDQMGAWLRNSLIANLYNLFGANVIRT